MRGIRGYRAQLGEYFFNVVDGSVDGVVDDLVLVLVGAGQLAAGHFKAALDCGFGFGAAGAEAAFQFLFGTWPQKNTGYVWKPAADFFRPLDVDI